MKKEKKNVLLKQTERPQQFSLKALMPNSTLPANLFTSKNTVTMDILFRQEKPDKLFPLPSVNMSDFAGRLAASASVRTVRPSR